MATGTLLVNRHDSFGGTRVQGADGDEKVEPVRVIDWDEPANNDFLLCSQLWVTGDMYTRRADLVGFVNESDHANRWGCDHGI